MDRIDNGEWSVLADRHGFYKFSTCGCVGLKSNFHVFLPDHTVTTSFCNLLWCHWSTRLVSSPASSNSSFPTSARSGHDVWYGVWPSDWSVLMTFGCWRLRFYQHESWPVWPIYVQVYCHLPLVCNGLRITGVASGVGRHKPAVHLPRLFLSCQIRRWGNTGSKSWHQLKVSQGGIACPTFAHTNLWLMISYKLTSAWMDRTGWGPLFLHYCYCMFFVYS